MKNYISVNVVSQSLILTKCIRDNNCCRMSELKELSLPYGVNLSVALAFAIQCGWISDMGDVFSFTEGGNKIAEMFNGLVIGTELWKKILYLYISACQPAWAKRIPYGRKEAYIFMNEEEQRCFIESGLVSSQKDDVLTWWDMLAETQRFKQNALLDDIGRRGERLTMKFEEMRTGVKPDWHSIETNRSGYDILSQRSSEDSDSLLIEVKSSSQPLETACAIISRHEWEVASLPNNQMRYLFYFWKLGTVANQLAIITVEEMSCHIPIDHECGVWENVRIPFAIFADRFSQHF